MSPIEGDTWLDAFISAHTAERQAQNEQFTVMVEHMDAGLAGVAKALNRNTWAMLIMNVVAVAAIVAVAGASFGVTVPGVEVTTTPGVHTTVAPPAPPTHAHTVDVGGRQWEE
jgi:hypothetical protein